MSWAIDTMAAKSASDLMLEGGAAVQNLLSAAAQVASHD